MSEMSDNNNKGDGDGEEDRREEEEEEVETPEIEMTHVREFYETAAEHFSRTRHSPWPRVKQFIQSLPNGSSVADLGCGNGKVRVASNSTRLSIDLSIRCLSSSVSRIPDVVRSSKVMILRIRRYSHQIKHRLLVSCLLYASTADWSRAGYKRQSGEHLPVALWLRYHWRHGC